MSEILKATWAHLLDGKLTYGLVLLIIGMVQLLLFLISERAIQKKR